MKISVVTVAALLAVAVAAGGGYWLGQKKNNSPGKSAQGDAGAPGGAGKAAGGSAPAVVVEAITVSTAAMPQTITAVGSLRSDESVTMRPEVAGRIVAIGFEEGRPVSKGAVLIKLDPAVNAAEVQQAVANITLAKAKYERAVDLQKKGFISGQARDEAENNLRIAEAAEALAAARLAKTEIRAPFSGIIGLRQVSIGDYVKEGQDMVNLESIDPLKVDFRLPEKYLQQARVGQTLQINLDAMKGGATYEGKVSAINPLVDSAGRAIVIRAVVRNADAALRPGMFARVRLLMKEEGDALVLPEQALVPQGEDQYVFRVIDGKAARTKIEVGQRRGGNVEIVKGLTAGDTVVIAGQLKIRDGTAVTYAAAEKTAGNVPAPKAEGREMVPTKDGVLPASVPKS